MLSTRLDSVAELNSGSITFSNGSRITGRAAGKDSLRGLVIDQVVIMDAAWMSHKTLEDTIFSTRYAASTATSKLIIQSTPKIAGDIFHQFYENADLKIHQAWSLHPHRDNIWAEKFKLNNGASSFASEYDALFIHDFKKETDPS